MESKTAITSKVPLIRNYQCYRIFMSDVYKFKRQMRSGFSYRRFSQLAGLKSPNFLHMVIIGKRNLSNDLAPKIAKAMGLSPGETQYFVGMVKRDNAKSNESAESAQREMMVGAKKILTKEIPKAQAEILTKWYYMVIREMVFLKDFEPSGDWISKKLREKVSPKEAERAFSFLLKSGFVVQSNDGSFHVADPVIDTGDALLPQKILQGHIDILKVWTEILPEILPNQRELGFINIPISANKINELKERIRTFQDEIIGWLQDESNPETVIQLGTYLIPIVRS